MSEKMSEMSAHLMSEMRIELANYVEEARKDIHAPHACCMYRACTVHMHRAHA